MLCEFFPGFVIEYISHPVINSFTTASAITIAEAQFKVRANHFNDLDIYVFLPVPLVLCMIATCQTFLQCNAWFPALRFRSSVSVSVAVIRVRTAVP